MSRFFSDKFSSLTPYTPGEQPKDRRFVKLNTNESPFAPSQKAREYAATAAKSLQLYCDIDCTKLCEKLARMYGIKKENVLFTNGSDEALNFAFAAFCDDGCPAVFPDITYGFYPVFAQLNHVPYEEIPLDEDFRIRPEDYFNSGKTVFIANPNAPTGIALPLKDVEAIIASNRDTVVVVDEAYVDFGGESAISLIPEYENLIVVQTFSKSRSMAGARLGFVAGNAELIRDLDTVRFSTNPYNVNRMTMAAGIGVLKDQEYTDKNIRIIVENREFLTEELMSLGFELTDSRTNFVFARHPQISGEKIYLTLKERGVLVRHFTSERIREYNRITIGSREELMALLTELRSIIREELR